MNEPYSITVLDFVDDYACLSFDELVDAFRQLYAQGPKHFNNRDFALSYLVAALALERLDISLEEPAHVRE